MAYLRIKQATKTGFILFEVGVANLGYPSSKTRRGRVQDEGRICPTLTAGECQIYRIEEDNENLRPSD